MSRIEFGEGIGDLDRVVGEPASREVRGQLGHPVVRHPGVDPLLEVGGAVVQLLRQLERRRGVAAQHLMRRRFLADAADRLIEPAQQCERQSVGRLVERR